MSGMTSDSGFDDVLIVHPTELKIPIVLNEDDFTEELSSWSIQLTNITDRIVAYTFLPSSRIDLVSPDRYTAGTILPHSTSSVTLTVNLLGKKAPPEDKKCIIIWAYVVKDGVKAEDITSRKHFISLTDTKLGGIFRMPVVYNYYTVPAANPYSAVSEKKEKFIHESINDEVHGTTSEGKGSESSVRRQSSNEMSSIILFSDDEIKGATNGLSGSSMIRQGGYMTVYKGYLHDIEVAIKMLDPNSQQGIDEFLQEMEVLGRMRHRNLAKLIGACVPLRALIFEFVPNGSLEDCLQNSPRLLTWKMRTRIVYDICLTLTFLHSIKPQPVIHGDLNPANILLDGNFICKLANFGLYRFLPGGTANDSFLDTKPKGTLGYIDPEFLKTGILTIDYDVYSFGVTILRLLTGMDALGTGLKVRSAYKKKLLMEMVDPKAGQWPTHVSEFLAYFGLACCARKKKPGLMMEIAKDLEKILDIVDEEYY